MEPGGNGGAVPHTMETIMQPTTVLAIALVVGAVLGTFVRLWTTPAFETWSKQLIVEVLSNGAVAVLIPYAAKIPGVGAVLPDLSLLPPVPAGVVMFFFASGSGDFFSNLRKKITGGS